MTDTHSIRDNMSESAYHFHVTLAGDIRNQGRYLRFLSRWRKTKATELLGASADSIHGLGAGLFGLSTVGRE